MESAALPQMRQSEVVTPLMPRPVASPPEAKSKAKRRSFGGHGAPTIRSKARLSRKFGGACSAVRTASDCAVCRDGGEMAALTDARDAEVRSAPPPLRRMVSRELAYVKAPADS